MFLWAKSGSEWTMRDLRSLRFHLNDCTVYTYPSLHSPRKASHTKNLSSKVKSECKGPEAAKQFTIFRGQPGRTQGVGEGVLDERWAGA